MMSLLRGTHTTNGVPSSASHSAESIVRDGFTNGSSTPGDMDASETSYVFSDAQQNQSQMTSSPFKRRSRAVGSSRTVSGRYMIDHVKHQHQILRKRCHEQLGASVSHTVFDTTYGDLMDWIRSERLSRLPHKGGAWDRVLLAAQYFAEQVHSLRNTTSDFISDSSAAASLIFGQCLLLLELGHQNATALRKVFKLFYQFGNELALLLRRAELFRLNISIQEGIGYAFVALLNVTSAIAVHFHWAVHGHQRKVSLDIYAEFGHLIEHFRSQVGQVAKAMWAASLAEYGYTDETSIADLSSWLAPQDSVLALLSSNHISLVNQPDDCTCVWFQPRLIEFVKSKKKIMLVEGKSASGKSTLAHWVTDRLQRPIARRNVSTISFSFNQTIPALSTSLAMIKTLLYQLLELYIGNVNVYEAIEKVYRESEGLNDAKELEEKLWSALSSIFVALDSSKNEDMVIVLDGVDETHGQKKAAPAIVKRLYDISSKSTSIQILNFSIPLDMNLPDSTVFPLTNDSTAEDLRMLLHQTMSIDTEFRQQGEIEKEKMVEGLVTTAEGSFLWAGLASQLLRWQDSLKALAATAESLQSANNKVADVVLKLLAAMNLGAEGKSLISWLCAAERPLTFEEVKLLMQCNVDKKAFVERNIDVDSILRSIRPFVIVGDGLVTLRHLSIKHALVNIPNLSKNSLQLTDRQRDLCVRLLIYGKYIVKDEHQVTLGYLDMGMVRGRFQKSRLLEYTVRYWAEHLRKIPSYKDDDLGQFTAFKDFFPSSVTFALLEQTCWQTGSPLPAIQEYCAVASRFRQALFGQDLPCVLQAMISYASVCEKLRMTNVLVQHCTTIIRISKTLFSVESDVTVDCLTWTLRVTEGYTTKSRTEVMSFREEAYLQLVECYTYRYRATSVQVLEVYQKLAELYVFINEEHKATEIYKIIQKITATLYGEQSDEARSLSGQLGVTLRQHEHVEEIDTYEGSIFEDFTEESKEEFTVTVVQRIISMCSTYITRGKLDLAERTYVELWLRLTEQCRLTQIVEWHEQKVYVMLLYAKFLESRKRTSEASAVLLCLWREYEYHAFSVVESIVMHLKEVGILMKKLTMISMSLEVFKKCWSYFKSTNRTNTSVSRELEEYINTTSKEIVQINQKVTVKESSETVIREIIESSLTSSSTEVSTTTVELCKSLTSIYIKEERYSEAVKCIKTVVKKSWSSFFSSDTAVLSSTVNKSSIDLVVQLAVCYIKQSRIEKAESVYVRLYHAIRTSHRVDDELVIKYSEALLSFYKAHGLISKAISFQQELLVDYRAFYGHTHQVTIRTLYALGDLCRHHYRTHGYWIEYYLEIVHSLNKDSTICHHDALQALIIVAESYYEDGRYSESLIFYRIIAATFFKHGTSYALFKQTTEVQSIFEHYERSLIESKTETSVQLTMLKEYREACIRHFTESSSIVTAATMQYASTCMRSESHQSEAISLYEYLSKHTSNTEVVNRSKTTLRSLYIKEVRSSSRSTSVSKTTLEMASTLIYEHYSEIRKTHSCSHETTLNALSELIQTYYRQSKTELIIKELRSFVVESLTQITDSRELMMVAVRVASLYRETHCIDHAESILSELKTQIIFKSTHNVSKCGFDMTKLNHSSLVFLATFEYEIMYEKTVTVTELIAEYSAMSLYYQDYSHSIRSKANFSVVFMSAARLRHVLGKRKRIDYYYTIDQEVLSHFSSHESKVIKAVGSTIAIKLFVTTILDYCEDHRIAAKDFVAVSGRAASYRISALLKEGKHADALELCKCTFHYLMDHRGLDDPTEIGQGLTLCLMMAGRGYPRASDPQQYKQMMSFSRTILSQVFEIVEDFHINLARCKLEDLNNLVGLMGETNDFPHLQQLLSIMWGSREAQKWSQATTTSIARSLIQARFGLDQYTSAIRLTEDVLYNVRRVHGSRSVIALEFYDLLAQLYTSIALHHQAGDAKGLNIAARMYLRKAVDVHISVLRLFVGSSESSDEEDSSDIDAEISTASKTLNGNGGASHYDSVQDADKVKAIKRHVRLLKLAYQRLGGWSGDSKDVERLTEVVWQGFSEEMGMDKKQVLASQWSVQGYGKGKAEGREDEFVMPARWMIEI